jgi:hypothetical protein
LNAPAIPKRRIIAPEITMNGLSSGARLASIAHSAAITVATVHHLVTSGLIERRDAAIGGLRGGLTPHSAHPGAHINGRAQGFAVPAARGLDGWP